jgi:hypothetical protein
MSTWIDADHHLVSVEGKRRSNTLQEQLVVMEETYQNVTGLPTGCFGTGLVRNLIHHQQILNNPVGFEGLRMIHCLA